MSLPRASYLESWEYDPPRQRRTRTDEEEGSADADDDDDDNDGYYYRDLPESDLSSSFPSTFSRRLTFNPYSGPAWGRGITTADQVTDADNNQCQNPPDAADSSAAGRDEDWVPQKAALKVPDLDVPETRGAFEVSERKRIAQVCVAVVYCFLSAGIVFGFAAVKPVLIREGVYRQLCSKEEIDEDVNVCYGQEFRLNLMFTIAAVATNIAALPVGTILDFYGPRVCGIIGSLCLALGAILFAFSERIPFDAYISGYLLLSLGGSFVFISSFHLSNTFPLHSGLILSTLTGAFDASSAFFLFFRLANESSNGYFSTRKLFTAYLVVPLFVFVVQIFIMPGVSYKTAGELVQQAEEYITAEANDKADPTSSDSREGERQRNHRRVHRQSVVGQIHDLLDDHSNENDNGNYYAKVKSYLFGQENNTNEPGLEGNPSPSQQPVQQQKPLNMHTAGGIWGALHGRSAIRQILTPWFILITLFTVLQMLRINYFVASINQQYTYLFSSHEKAKSINELFDFLLPLGGLASVPFIGTILDNIATPLVLFILVSIATLIGILGCIPNSMVAAYGNIVLLVLYRPFYYTAVSDYAAKVFGFQTFGKVYGLIICSAGIGNFLQAALDALTFKVFHRNPIPVNAFLTIAGFVAGGLLVGFVSWKARVMNMGGSSDGAAVDRSGDLGEEGVGIDRRDWENEPLLRRHDGDVGYGSVGVGDGRGS